MNDHSNPSSTALNEDQQAIADYYASRSYELTKSRPKPFRKREERPVWPDRVLTPATSFAAGLVGIGLVSLATAAVAPLLHLFLNMAVKPSGNFVPHAVFSVALVFPAALTFVMATTTPMFWYGSVLVRTAAALATALPACIVFYVTTIANDLVFHWAILLAMLCVAGTVPVMVQFVTEWSLSHSRDMETRAAPVGTRRIMELTIIAALVCALFINLDISDFIEVLLFFCALTGLGSMTVVSVLVAFLRPGNRNMIAAAVSVLFALATSFLYCGTIAFLEFGWAKLSNRLGELVIAAVIGLPLVLAMLAVYLWWLRSCGWACVNKAEEKLARQSESSEPWHFWFQRRD